MKGLGKVCRSGGWGCEAYRYVRGHQEMDLEATGLILLACHYVGSLVIIETGHQARPSSHTFFR